MPHAEPLWGGVAAASCRRCMLGKRLEAAATLFWEGAAVGDGAHDDWVIVRAILLLGVMRGGVGQDFGKGAQGPWMAGGQG